MAEEKTEIALMTGFMYRWFENVVYGADLAELRRDFPQPTDLESYLRFRLVLPSRKRIRC